MDDLDTVEVLTALNEGRAGYVGRTSPLSIGLRTGPGYTISKVFDL